MQNQNERIIYVGNIDKGRVFGMKIIRIIISLIIITVIYGTAVYAAEPAFSASSLTAKDVNCKKCHTATPHIIHANKSAQCVDCHGDKLSVSIPQCTKCHDGPIHKVHAGKVATQTCAYCHKTITEVHNGLMSEAVCSHCHKDLIQVHGADAACVKCHKSPPDIVKPIKSATMILICQNCHTNSSAATIHGQVTDKKGCYNCHKGTSNAVGSDIPHAIHASKVECKNCHEENGKVVIPQCTRCHDIDAIHAFNKIGKLTSTTGLRCAACHTEVTNLSPTPGQTQAAQTTSKPAEVVSTTLQPQPTGTEKVPGFSGLMVAAMLLTGYLVRRKI